MLNIFTSIQNQDQRFDLMIIKIIYDTNKWVLRVPILCHSAGVYTEFSTLSVTENRFEKLAFFLLISIIVILDIIRYYYILVHYLASVKKIRLHKYSNNCKATSNYKIVLKQNPTGYLFFIPR